MPQQAIIIESSKTFAVADLDALGRNLPPKQFELLIEFCSWWLQDWGLCSLAVHWPGVTLSFYWTPTFPFLCGPSIYKASGSVWNLSAASNLSNFLFCCQFKDTCCFLRAHASRQSQPYTLTGARSPTDSQGNTRRPRSWGHLRILPPTPAFLIAKLYLKPTWYPSLGLGI